MTAAYAFCRLVGLAGCLLMLALIGMALAAAVHAWWEHHQSERNRRDVD